MTKTTRRRPVSNATLVTLVNQLQLEVQENRKYADLVKSEVVAQAETRDALRQAKHFETVIKALEKRFDELSIVKVSQSLQNMAERFWRVEWDVQAYTGRVECTETAVKRLTEDNLVFREQLDQVKDELNQLDAPEPGEYVHSGSCFKAGDDVRTSCPECEPVRVGAEPKNHELEALKDHNKTLRAMLRDAFELVEAIKPADAAADRALHRSLLCRLSVYR